MTMPEREDQKMKGDLIDDYYTRHGDETPAMGYALCWPGGGASFATLDDLAAWLTAEKERQETPEQRAKWDALDVAIKAAIAAARGEKEE